MDADSGVPAGTRAPSFREFGGLRHRLISAAPPAHFVVHPTVPSVAFSHTRFRDHAPEGDHIPGSLETVVAAGVSLHDFYGGWFGSLRLRYFGPRSLIEDDSVRSPSTTVVNAQVGCQFNKTWSANVEVFNLGLTYLDMGAHDKSSNPSLITKILHFLTRY